MDKYKTTDLKMLIIYIKTSSLREGLYQFAVLNGSGWAVNFLMLVSNFFEESWEMQLLTKKSAVKHDLKKR